MKEEYTGNVGGETDIANPDNLMSEDGFTSETNPETNIIAKTFDTKGDFDSYVNQRRGIEMTSKDQQAILGYKKAKPNQQDKFFVKYESTDPFGNNNTTVIKKLKEGNQFCWTAFTKHENADEKENPSDKNNSNEKDEFPMKEADFNNNNVTKSIPPSFTNNNINNNSNNSDQDIIVDDPIRITKTTTFTDDSNGSNILGDFLQTLEL